MHEQSLSSIHIFSVKHITTFFCLGTLGLRAILISRNIREDMCRAANQNFNYSAHIPNYSKHIMCIDFGLQINFNKQANLQIWNLQIMKIACTQRRTNSIIQQHLIVQIIFHLLFIEHEYYMGCLESSHGNLQKVLLSTVAVIVIKANRNYLKQNRHHNYHRLGILHFIQNESFLSLLLDIFKLSCKAYNRYLSNQSCLFMLYN